PEDRGVALVPIGALEGGPQQALDRGGVADRGITSQHGQRQRRLVALQDLAGRVVGGIVADEELVLAGRVLEDLPDLPQDEADGGGLVPDREAEVDHRAGWVMATERYTSRVRLTNRGRANPSAATRPSPPSRSRRAGSSRRAATSRARAAGSSAGTRTPPPAASDSGSPPASEATTGTPRARASRTEEPNPSLREGCTSTAAAAITASGCSTCP